jgi:hypothetical protein
MVGAGTAVVGTPGDMEGTGGVVMTTGADITVDTITDAGMRVLAATCANVQRLSKQKEPYGRLL